MPTLGKQLAHASSNFLGYAAAHKRIRKEFSDMTTYRDRHLAGLTTDPNAAEDTTVADLKTALKTLGQPVTGNKTQLEKRLAKAQTEATSTPDPFVQGG